MPRILIVEDDPQISKLLKINLRLSGYETTHLDNIKDAWHLCEKQSFDLICLDIGLPDGSGLDLCQKIRQSGSETPILFISALTDEASVVKGLSRGADDYLRKPFGMEELKVRMNRMLKKMTPSLSAIKVGALTIDPVRKVASIVGKAITLGRKEMEILILLAKNAGDVVTRENILSCLYDRGDLYERTVDSHMSHLRRKLKQAAGDTIQINSVYGLGYRLRWK